MITPVKRRKISELVLEEITKLIKDGTFPMNSKLPSETELAKKFQVSRSPVREALSVLAATGVVESKQGGGNWVRHVNLSSMLDQLSIELVNMEQVFDLLELRTIVESEAAALAAKRCTEEDITEIAAALHAFGESMLKDENSIGDEADYRFHQMIVKASYNPFIIQTLDNISDLYQKAMTFSLKQNIGLKVKRESVYMEHKEIFKAIKNRQPDEAAQKMKMHLQTARIKLGDNRL